jgi:hypothetical protein
MTKSLESGIRAAGVWSAFLVLLGLSACAQQVRRVALVPAVAPPFNTGQAANDRLVGLTLGNSTFLRASSPHEASTAQNGGMYIPRSQWTLQALFSVVDGFRIGPKFEIGMREGANPIAENLPAPPDEPTVGFGPVIEYSIPVVPPIFRIGLGLELLWTFCPYAEYTGCTGSSGCKMSDSGTDSTGIVSFSVVPAVRLGPVTLFAGFGGRNQPTNVRDQVVWVADPYEDEVSFGKMYWLAYGGLQVHIGRYLELTAELYYPITGSPVAYGGPAMSAWLTVPLGEGPDQRRARRARYIPQQPYYTPPPYVPPAQPYAPQPPQPVPPPGPVPPRPPSPPPPGPPPDGPVDIQ